MTTFIAALRADLSHYTRVSLEETLGFEAMAGVRREQRVPALMRARRLCVLPGKENKEKSGLLEACDAHLRDESVARNVAACAHDDGVFDSRSYEDSASDEGELKARLALVARLLLLGDTLTKEELGFALPELLASGHAGKLVEECRASSGKQEGNDVEGKTEEKINFSDSFSRESSVYRARFQIVPVEVPPHVRAGSMCTKQSYSGEGRGEEYASGVAVKEKQGDVADKGSEGNKENDGAEKADITGCSVSESSFFIPREVLIASDWGELAGVQPQEDHVMPVGGATRTLAALATYKPGQRVLDIGTGCGVHAIFAALAGADVTATDISARALEYARFNAALNGVEIKLKEGSLAEPAEGLYDVVVSNPPFVITPGKVRDIADYQYRDGGLEGDSLLGALVSDLPRILASGGRAWMLGNWEIRGRWQEKPELWIGDELDAWVIQREELSPAQYVEMWLRDGGVTQRDERYEKMYEAWLTDFEERGVQYVGMGYMCLGMREHDACRVQNDVCSREGSPWRRFDVIRGPLPANLAEFTGKIWDQRYAISSFSSEAGIVQADVAGVRGPGGEGLKAGGVLDGAEEHIEVSEVEAVQLPGAFPFESEKLSEAPERVDVKVAMAACVDGDLEEERGGGNVRADFVSVSDEEADENSDECVLSLLDAAVDLMNMRLKVSAIEHRLHMPGSSDPFMIKLAQLEGFGEEIQVSSNVAAVVGACDGELTLGALCDAVAYVTGASPSAVRDEVLPAANELLAMGILTITD